MIKGTTNHFNSYWSSKKRGRATASGIAKHEARSVVAQSTS